MSEFEKDLNQWQSARWNSTVSRLQSVPISHLVSQSVRIALAAEPCFKI